MFDKPKKLEKYFKSRGIDCKWIKPDEYGFSRHLIFQALDTVCEIEWYCNYSTIMVDGVAHYWFNEIDDSNCYPKEGKWLEFKLGNEKGGLFIRVS